MAGQLLALAFGSEMPKRILIVDDSGTVRYVLKQFLRNRENVMVCGEATNGFEAIEQARRLQPDLILLDLAMPEMNGAEAASVLKKMMPGTRIILFTMYSENIGRSLTSAVGVDLVLSKPDGIKVLVEAVDGLLNPTVPRESDLDTES
jgi:DNA-binding NarL/FixJ family response regulator